MSRENWPTILFPFILPEWVHDIGGWEDMGSWHLKLRGSYKVNLITQRLSTFILPVCGLRNMGSWHWRLRGSWKVNPITQRPSTFFPFILPEWVHDIGGWEDRGNSGSGDRGMRPNTPSGLRQVYSCTVSAMNCTLYTRHLLPRDARIIIVINIDMLLF